MDTLKVTTNPAFSEVFANYPDNIQKKMMRLRNLVLETAQELEEVTSIEETLKWGEPSFITKHGSTLRIDWKAKTPNQYAMYFKCTSRLIETFRIVFKNEFDFDGNRAIVFQLKSQVPTIALKECIKATLTYHKVKQLPTLGINAV